MANESPFDINATSCVSRPLSIWDKAARDSINRMALLIGNIPFETYFTSPIGSIAQRMLENLDMAPADFVPFLPSMQGTMEAIHALLVTPFSFLDVLSKPEEEGLQMISGVLRAFHAIGIDFPSPTGDPTVDRVKLDALKRLLSIDEARNLTYRSIFEIAKSDVYRETSEAVVHAIKVGVLPPSKNNCIWNFRNSHCQPLAGCQCNGATSKQGVRECSLATFPYHDER
jgi:hypothetical protein